MNNPFTVLSPSFPLHLWFAVVKQDETTLLFVENGPEIEPGGCVVMRLGRQ